MAIDIDGVARPIVPRWMVGEPGLEPVPPLPDGVAPDSRIGSWYDRDGWRKRFTERHGRAALAELDRLRPFTLTVDWRGWPVTHLHMSWVRSFGSRDRAEAGPGAVAFVQDAHAMTAGISVSAESVKPSTCGGDGAGIQSHVLR